MQRTDKLLLGIVAGIVVLVLVAFAVFWLRPEPRYLADDTPEHIVHNYLLALQKQDYDRAYGYLLPTLGGYPRSINAFRADINSSRYEFDLNGNASTFQIDPAEVAGEEATVNVRQRVFYEGGLFSTFLETSGSYDNNFGVTLERPSPGLQWKISHSDGFWRYCWSQPEGC